MSYYADLVQQIKDKVAKNSYPPVFTKKNFNFSKRNCYAYALDLNVHDPKKRVLYPGCISSEKEDIDIYSVSGLLKRLQKDLKFLGFTFRPNNKKLEENEYRIAIYAFPSLHDTPIDFHFARQDKDGYWSEKPSWNSMPRKLDYCGIDSPKLVGEKPCYKQVLIIKKV
ncbi:MAG: hypothetical protein IKG42_02660 [Clostridia bacterium]|nr:hypothetical protein [Clostridia bacterium]